MNLERRHKTILAAGLAVAAAFAALAAYWVWAASQVEDAIAGWAEAQRARGYAVAYRGPALGGFPFTLSARLEAPSVEAPAGWRWSGDAIVGRGAIWAPLTLDLELPRAQQVRAVWRGRDRRLAVSAADGRGAVRFRTDGEIDSASLRIADLAVRGETGWSARAAGLDYDLTTMPAPSDRAADPPRVAIEGAAREVMLPEIAGSPFGETLQHLGVSAEIVGRVPPGDPALALAAWRDRGGRVAVRGLDLRWGPIEIAAQGTAVLDALLRPEGVFDARIRGLPEALDALAKRGKIESGAVFALKMTAIALSETEPGNGRPVVALPITLRDGLVYLGPVAIFPIGPVL